MVAIRTGRNRWNASPETVAKLESSSLRVRYDDAPLARDVDPRYRSATRTQIPPGDGTRKLRNFLVAEFGIRQTYTPGRSRPHTDGSRLDTHEAGQGIDLMTNDAEQATRIAAWLADHAEELGLQCIIAFGNRWYSGRDPGQRFRGYEGVNLHTDHLHIELNRDGAAGRTPWFQGRTVADASHVADGEARMLEGDNVWLQWGAVAGVVAGVALVLAGAYYVWGDE